MRKPAIVLLVDDDPLVVRSLLRMLSSAAYELIASHTVDDALLLLQSIGDEVHVVLIADVNLIRSSGLELAKRASLIRPRLRTLFTTGGDVPPGEEHRTLVKPFNLLDLRRRILSELLLIADS